MFSISKESFISFITLMTAGLFIGLPLYFYVPYWYSAYQASRITDPEAYYQKEVGEMLLEHGTEYKLEPKADTSDWKTYENKEYGFSFKYPKDAVVTEEMGQDYNWPEPHLVIFVKYPSQEDASDYMKNHVASLSVYKYPKGWNIYFNPYKYLNELNLYDQKKYIEAYLNLEPWQRVNLNEAGSPLLYSKTSASGLVFASSGGFCFSTIAFYPNYANCAEDNTCSDNPQNKKPSSFGFAGKNNGVCLNIWKESDDINNAIVDSFRFQ